MMDFSTSDLSVVADIASERLLPKEVSMPEYVEVDFSGIFVTG